MDAQPLPQTFPSAWRGILVVLCYAVPIITLGLFYLPIEPGGCIFYRNWIRAGCGPVVQVMGWAGSDPNDLGPYAVAFSVIWPVWLLATTLTPLHRVPLVIHAATGMIWCFGGCCLTAAI